KLSRDASDNSLRKLKSMQLPSGAFPWFTGGEENEYLNTHIVAGLAHLNRIDADNEKFESITRSAVIYLDKKFMERFATRVQSRINFGSYPDIHYMYMRSYFIDDYPLDINLYQSIDFQIS